MIENQQLISPESLDVFVDFACRLTRRGDVLNVLRKPDFLDLEDVEGNGDLAELICLTAAGSLEEVIEENRSGSSPVEITFSLPQSAPNRVFQGVLEFGDSGEELLLTARERPEDHSANGYQSLTKSTVDFDKEKSGAGFRISLLESLAETMTEGLLVVDEHREIVFFNRRFRKIWNIPAEVLESRSSREAVDYVLDQVKNPAEFKRNLNHLYQNPREESRDVVRFEDGRIIDRFSAPVLGEGGTFYGRLWVFRDVTDQKRREEKLDELTTRYELALDATQTGFFEWDLETDTGDWDERTRKLFGFDDSAGDIEYGDFLDRIHPRDRHDLKTSVVEAMREGRPFRTEFRVRADGGVRWIQTLGDLIVEEEGHRKLIGLQRDISGEKRIHRALEVTSQCRENIIRADEEQQLLKDVCRTLTSEIGYEFAWIGYARTDQEKQLDPVAASQPDHPYLEDLDVRWSREPEGYGPSGVAFRHERPVSAQNIREDKRFRPWRDDATEQGFESSLALPLITEELKLGVINIYAGDPYAFGKEEREWLQQLANDVAFGVEFIRTEQQLKETSLSLEEKTTLLEEIHHRVKNNMQVINSLISHHTRQMENDPNKELMRDCQDRIKSMAMVHEMLYQSDNLAEIALRRYVRRLIERIMDSYSYDEDNIHLTLRIDPELDLPLEETIACGLMIHELVSNSFQHAFEHDRTNELFVELSRVSGQVKLTVQDNGPGFSEGLQESPEENDSLGFEIVKALGCYELGGELEFRNEPRPSVELTFSV